MALTTKSILFLVTLLCCGLSAGFFYAWAVSVIPGTRRISDASYLETMQHINRAILNPAFFIVFFGSPILLTLSTLLQYRVGQGPTFWWLLLALLLQVLGTFGVTILGNVPLNENLDEILLSHLDEEQLKTLRKHYEGPWNRWHMVRTVASVASFLMLVIAQLTKS